MSDYHPEGFAWLGEIPPPRTLNSALFVADGPDWLRNALADAGKLFVPHPPVDMAGGVTLVGEAGLFEIEEGREEVALPRPDLSDGARRLKPSSRFDPALIGTVADEPWLGDIAVSGKLSGIVLGDDGKRVAVLTARRTVEWVLIAKTVLRRPPYTNGIFTARRIHLDREGQPKRETMPDLWADDAQ